MLTSFIYDFFDFEIIFSFRASWIGARLIDCDSRKNMFKKLHEHATLAEIDKVGRISRTFLDRHSQYGRTLK